jgi:ribonuclease Z
MLFDCGEGTQQQMMRAKTGMMKLSSIFITHLHADHILGIPGLVQTMSFQGRTDPLFIYAPERSGDQIEQLTRIGHTRPKFEVQITELFPGDVVEVDEYDILAIRTEHNMPSIGYALSEHQRTGRFNRERAIELGVPPGPLFSRLQRGESVVPGDVLGSPRPGRKIVYTGDTRPTEEVLEASRDADLLIHDSSLAHDLIGWARETMHSTAREAALLAKEAGVRELVLTHISYDRGASIVQHGTVVGMFSSIFHNNCTGLIVSSDVLGGLIHSPHLRTSSASCCPYLGMYSSTTLLRSTATGFKSLAKASAPTRRASSGIAPLPAKGSTTSGFVPGTPPNASCAAGVSARLASGYSFFVELSQLAKSAMKSSRGAKLQRVIEIPGLQAHRVPELLHDLGCRRSELLRAERVSRIDPERGTDHSPARSKRASRPPDVKRRDVSVPNALLAAGVCADLLDGEIHLDQAFGVLVRSISPFRYISAGEFDHIISSIP